MNLKQRGQMQITGKIVPYARAIKYNWLRLQAGAYLLSYNTRAFSPKSPEMIFVIGCGRSGTTLLGEMLSYYPSIHYYFEPYHLWAAVDKRTDILNLFHRVEGSLIMDEHHWNVNTKRRFIALFGRYNRTHNAHSLTVEKTPLNAFRIGFLNKLAPNCKFIHIVRDGIEVSHSIEHLANANTYKIAGKPRLNQWWGIDESKWKALYKDGISAGYYTDELPLIQSNLARASYEWLSTQNEIDKWRNRLNSRLLEIRYTDLVENPKSTLSIIARFLDLDLLNRWLHKASSKVHLSQGQREYPAFNLPPQMCKSFNFYQRRFGFNNFASVASTLT